MIDVRQMWSDPFVRNAHLLTISSMAASGVGILFWAVAAHLYDTETVGKAYAVTAAVALLAGIAQLNLYSGLVRFIQPAGRRAPALIYLSYAITTVFSVLVGVGFVLFIPLVSPSLNFVSSSSVLAAVFVGMTVTTAIFHMQDNALTGLKKTVWVPVDNIAFAVAKLVLLIAFAAALPVTGILVSWFAALVVAVVAISVYLFGFAIPQFAASSPSDDLYPGTPAVMRYVATDYIGSSIFLTTKSVLPLIVINMLGAEVNAYFATAWLIFEVLTTIAANAGISMQVETSTDHSAIEQRCRDMLRHTIRMVLPICLLVFVAAPIPLMILGTDYANGAADVLRLLALAAIPNIVIQAAMAGAKAHRRVGFTNVVRLVQCVLVLGGSAAVAGTFGVIGVGYVVLATEIVLAIAVWMLRPYWLFEKASSAESAAAAG